MTEFISFQIPNQTPTLFIYRTTSSTPFLTSSIQITYHFLLLYTLKIQIKIITLKLFVQIYTMEKTAIPACFQLFGLIDIFFLHLFYDWVISIQKFFSRSQSFLQSKLDFFGTSNVWTSKNNADFESSNRQFSLNKRVDDDGSLCREDVEMVMASLGIFCSQESEKLQESLGVDELSRLFEEKEPSFEEVKEAFYVFDENRDGFIDASELQRVLSILGLRQGSKLENCIKMIRTFDENGDGKIDFNEFVKFMENSLC